MDKKTRILLLALVFFISIAIASAADVDKDGSNTTDFYPDCDDNNPDVLPPRHGLLINRSITLCPGFYNLDATGSGHVMWMDLYYPNVTLDCNHAEINGTGTGHGISVGWGDYNNIIKNCNVSNYNQGIHLGYSRIMTIKNNRISNNNKGLYAENFGDIRMINNTFFSNHHGIYLSGGGAPTRIVGNVMNNDNYSVYLHQSGLPWEPDYGINISGNTFNATIKGIFTTSEADWSKIYLNIFYTSGTNDSSGTSPWHLANSSYCVEVDGTYYGNFYEHTIPQNEIGLRGNGECGIPKFLTPSLGEVNDKQIILNWTPQSSIKQIDYSLYYSNYYTINWVKIWLEDYIGAMDSSRRAAYGFEEASGDIVYDQTGNGHDGTIFNVTRTSGRYGYGLEFNGTNSRVRVPYSTDWAFNSTTSFTLETWARPRSFNSSPSNTIIWVYNYYNGINSCPPFSGTGGGGNAYGLVINTSGNPCFYLRTGTGQPYYCSNEAISLNQWHHFVGVRKYLGGVGQDRIYLYVDGILKVNQTATESGAVQTQNKELTLGVRTMYDGCSNLSGWFNGTIDSVAIYERELTKEEVIHGHFSETEGFTGLNYYWPTSSLANGNYFLKIIPKDDAVNGTIGYSDIFSIGHNCTPPRDDLYINENTILCDGRWVLNDTNDDGIIIINNSNVLLDCDGVSIVGDGSGTGIANARNYNTIKNCNISNFDVGLNSTGNYNNIINNIFSLNYYGMMVIDSIYNEIRENIADSNEHGLVFVSINSVQSQNQNQVHNNTAIQNNQNGFYLIGPNTQLNTFSNNSAVENNIGFYLDQFSQGRFYNNYVVDNTMHGFYVESSNINYFMGDYSFGNNYGYTFNDSSANQVIKSIMNNNAADVLADSTSIKINSVIDSQLNGVSSLDAGGIQNIGFYNVSFNKNNVNLADSAKLAVYWNLKGYLEDEGGIPVNQVDIYAKDKYGALTSTQSNSFGLFGKYLREYEQNSTVTTNFNNYTINITKPGYSIYIISMNITGDVFLNLTINITGGIIDTIPPTAPAVADGLDYIDRDWINDPSTLHASWWNSTDRNNIFYTYRIFEDGICLPGYCAEISAEEKTQISVTNLTLQEGSNYSFAVRARDSLYYYSNFSFSDGAVLDITPPTVTINSSTHPGSEISYSNPNVEFEFYGYDSASGISGYSYILNQLPGTAPDTVRESKVYTLLNEMKNNGKSMVLKENGTGFANSIYTLVNGNLTEGDTIRVSVALVEKNTDTIDKMRFRTYVVPGNELIDGFDQAFKAASSIVTHSADITYQTILGADIYSAELTMTENTTDSFYVVVSGLLSDDNTNSLVIAASNTPIDNSTSVIICNSSNSCANVTGEIEYAIKVEKKEDSSVWKKSYISLANGVYWFHVRAQDVAGNWGNPSHYKIMIDTVNGTPGFELVKPRGCVINPDPKLVVRTGEVTRCYYNSTNITATRMTSYDGRYHEAQLRISNGTHIYTINCTDSAGNSNTTTAVFAIDSNATPSLVSLPTIGDWPARMNINLNVNVTGSCAGATGGIEGLADDFKTSILEGAEENFVYSDVVDRGNGIYELSFETPPAEGTYTFKVDVRGAVDTGIFNVISVGLTITYTSPSMDSIIENQRMVYSAVPGQYIIGLASDSNTTTVSSGGPSISISKGLFDENAFIFLTRSGAEVGETEEELIQKTFLDLTNPMFSNNLAKDIFLIMASLEYDNIAIEGLDNVASGRYTLLIRNEGIDPSTGKTNISIQII